METALGHQQHGQQETSLGGLLTDQAAELGTTGQWGMEKCPGTAVEFAAILKTLVRDLGWCPSIACMKDVQRAHACCYPLLRAPSVPS